MKIGKFNPLREVEWCIGLLGDAQVFSLLEVNSVYCQVEEEFEKEKMLSICISNLSLQRRTTRLRNALATFQNIKDIVLCSVKVPNALVYIKDIAIFWKCPGQDKYHTVLVPMLLRESAVALWLKSCAFFTNKIKSVGHIIRLGCSEVRSPTTAALYDTRVPMTSARLRRKIGLWKVSRRFVWNLARIASTAAVRTPK